MYATYVTALYQAAATALDPALKDFENQFAPIPKKFDDTWLGILLACVSLVGTVGVSGFFNTGKSLVSTCLPMPLFMPSYPVTLTSNCSSQVHAVLESQLGLI